MQQRMPARTSAAVSPRPRELKAAFAALGLRCIAGIGASPAGPLRLVNTGDVRLEVKRQQQYSPVLVQAWVELYVPEACADGVHQAVMFWAADQGRVARGSWLLLTPADLRVMVVRALSGLAPGVRALGPGERLAAAERWLDKQWGG